MAYDIMTPCTVFTMWSDRMPWHLEHKNDRLTGKQFIYDIYMTPGFVIIENN